MAAITHWHGVNLAWAYGALLQGIQQRTRCWHRACDALQEALLRLALSSRPQPLLEPQAYLRTIVGSVLADEQRRAARRPLLAGDLHPDAPDDTTALDRLSAGQAPSAESLAALRQQLEATLRWLDSLPPRCREAFCLFRIEGLSQADIAARMGISVNMVERHVMRALLGLRQARDQAPGGGRA